MYQILIVEDDRLLAESLKKILELHFYEVEVAETAGQARETDWQKPDLFILDIGLPDGDGIGLCQEIREVSDRPVLILTAYDAEEKVLRAFRAGADDYVVKPFRAKELMARMSALLRRSQSVRQIREYRSLGLSLQPDSQKVQMEGAEVPLSQVEYELLLLLLRYQGSRVTRNMAFNSVWADAPDEVEDNTLSVTISRLRRKLEKAGCRGGIETCWGSGYRWALPVEIRFR